MSRRHYQRPTYHSVKSKFVVFKGVSYRISLDESKEQLDFNKITYAEAERMKSKNSGKELPFIKLKCDDPEQAEAIISASAAMYARKQASVTR